MVEHDLAKVGVAGSNPVSRSSTHPQVRWRRSQVVRRGSAKPVFVSSILTAASISLRRRRGLRRPSSGRMRRWLIAEQPRFWLPSRTARLRSRRPEKVREALALRAEGCATKTIARRLGIARSTVRYWLDRCAGVAQSAEAIGLKPIQCGFDSHHQHQPEYAYLLGMYLGDGCISRMPRTYVLRIFLHRKQIDVIERVNHALRSLLPDHRVGYVLAVTMPVSPSRPTSTDGPIFFLTTVWGVSTHAP